MISFWAGPGALSVWKAQVSGRKALEGDSEEGGVMTETLLGVLMGVALAAACGLRVFAPLLVLSLGAQAGVVPVEGALGFLDTWAATLGLSVATGLEVAASSVPWVEHALDAVASPAAILAGTALTGLQFEHLHPALAWSLGLVAGGGTAGVTQALGAGTRGAATLTTGGVVNPVLNLIQTVLSVVMAVLAVVVPVLAGLVLLMIVALVGTWWWKRRRRGNRLRGLAGAA